MSSLFSLPWSSSSSRHNNTKRPNPSGSIANDGNVMVEQYYSDLTENDTELAALLAEVAASGQPITEDVLVDKLLTQFPVYGSNHHHRRHHHSHHDDDEDGDVAVPPNSKTATASAPSVATSGDTTATPWLQWMGATGGGNAADIPEEDYPIDNSMNPKRKNSNNSDVPSSPAAGAVVRNKSPLSPSSEQEDEAASDTEEDWDFDEQCLWKKQQYGDNNNKPRNKSQQLQKLASSSTSLRNNTNNNSSHRRLRRLTSSTSARILLLPGYAAAAAAVTTTTTTTTVRNNKDNNESSNKSIVADASSKSETTATNEDSKQDETGQLVVPPPTPTSTTTTANKAMVATTNSITTSLRPVDRQYWMPDQLCRQCYACETPFTMFRRRHHCRLCGQVFCNLCSAYFVSSGGGSSGGSGATADGTDPPNNTQYKTTSSSTISYRTCRLCYEHANRNVGVGVRQPPEAEAAAATTTTTTATTNPTTAASNTHTTITTPLSGESTRKRMQQQAQESNKKVVAADDDTASSNPRSSDASTTNNIDKGAEKRRIGMPNSNADSSTATTTMTTDDSSIRERVLEGKSHLGRTAAEHLELMARELLRLHAPLLWNAPVAPGLSFQEATRQKDAWIHKLLTLATRCCATVSPNVKKGDLLDIRPCVKVKVIPGGSYRDCAYLSGILFRKTVSHKKMAREVNNPKIMLLSGGIEFTRTENRMASLETLFEQEETYMEILVGKILKLKPDVLLVGRSVNRIAQELLLKAGVILVQHVKSTLLSRISRQTGATVISSTDHVMNQFGASVLGKCRRFRLVTFRDNEAWTDGSMDQRRAGPAFVPPNGKRDPKKPQHHQRSIKALLADPKLSNHERQAALAANRLGENVLDGVEAVEAGLSKRGVTHTFIMLEGCPKHLGCTVVLRGANRAALKQVKAVFRFLASAAYNLLLETTYLKERGARLRPDFKVLPQHTFSSSLCVNYGRPPSGRKVRPWNGGNAENVPRTESGELSALDHQSILITSVWMTDKTQCCPAEVKGICYYSLQDVALGQFLRDSCFNLNLKCQNSSCKKSVLDHSLSFVHNDGLINITVEEMDEALRQSEGKEDTEDDDSSDEEDEAIDQPIATWTYCQNCEKVVTPLTYISENTWKFSFGKFLEVFFYNRDAIFNAPGHQCSCNLQTAATLYFGCGKLAARFTYESVSPFGVFVRKTLPIDITFHRTEAIQRLDFISVESNKIFVEFDKHIERIVREARSLFNSAMNRPEHLQTVLSELNRIGAEVDHASRILQDKIASMAENCRRYEDNSINSALFRFPLFARRYMFNLTSSWNEKLSACGQAITAMKKIASSNSLNDGPIGPNVPPGTSDPLHDELAEGMKRLRKLIDHYERYNTNDITQVLPSLTGNSDAPANEAEYDEEFDDPDTSMDFSDGVDADVIASRRRLKGRQGSIGNEKDETQKQTRTPGSRRSSMDFSSDTQETSTLTTAPPKPTPGGAVKSALTRFFNRGGRDSDQYVVDLGFFAEGRPRLPPGRDGLIVPVVDEQLSTIIAYSLASAEYAKQFKHFAKAEGAVPADGHEAGGRGRKAPLDRPDLDEGVSDQGFAKGPTDGREKRHDNFARTPPTGEVEGTERRMLNRNKSHIKHTFRDVDEKGQVTCKFVCTTYWATQFHAVRQGFLLENVPKFGEGSSSSQSIQDVEQCYIESLCSAYSWAASGGKSGASFARTADDRFVIKCISRTELQMFLDCALAYFEYLSKAFFHGLPTVLCKIVGVYQIGVHNRETGKRSMEQVAVMQNIFYNKKITKIFDLKGSLRGRFAAHIQSTKDDGTTEAPSGGPENLSGYARRGSLTMKRTPSDNSLVDDQADPDEKRSQNTGGTGPSTLLDGDFLEFTFGRPMPLTDRAKAVFQMSILNDTLFLSIINVLDYSILVGIDEENMSLVVGIIDFMRQYDILKQMERVGKSLPMVVGSEAPTIIQPPLYKARFTNAMERYFMTVPSKWTTI